MGIMSKKNMNAEEFERAKKDAEQFNDYLVTFEVEQWHNGERLFKREFTIRVAGTSLPIAIDGAKTGLNEVFTEVKAVKARNDHTDEDIKPPFYQYHDLLNDAFRG